MSDYIPIELQYDIINRLPVKSILAFRNVSKQWKSYIDSSDFIQQYSCRETAIDLAVDSASVTSFSMLFSIPIIHSVKLIGFTNNDAPIVEVDELGYQLAYTLQVYDPVYEEFQGVCIEADGGSFYIGPYKESLILLNRPDRSLCSLTL
ncbi:F-box domain containing protein [Tanacetum coccineum]